MIPSQDEANLCSIPSRLVNTMSLAKAVTRKLLEDIAATSKSIRALQIYGRYRNFTMVSPETYVSNLVLCANKAPNKGCIVEAGVWRGGMSAGIADMLPGRVSYLFDSFEGLPPAKEIDGEAALQWQRNVSMPTYYDNCRAERSFSAQAMAMTRAKQFYLIEGWFSDSLVGFVPEEPIAILRLDGDWSRFNDAVSYYALPICYFKRSCYSR